MRQVSKQQAESRSTSDCGWKVAAVGLKTILGIDTDKPVPRNGLGGRKGNVDDVDV